MARIRVVTDSASDLPDDIAARLGIDVVSLTIRFGEEEFTDRVELTPEVFWAKCKTSKTLPETSAPSVGAFQAAYERAKDDGYDGVLVLTLSSLLSATYQSASLAADAVKDLIDVRVIDTMNVSMGQGLIAIDVAESAAEGADLGALADRATTLLAKSGVVGTIDTLEHLIKGGRIGGAKALIGQVLSIKPLVELKGGVVAEAGRQRTRAKALSAVAAATAAHAPLRRLALVHGACTEADVAALRALANEIKSEFPLVVTDIGPVVGTHAGPGIIALTFVES
jgi:DegV family protein with EDD domain